MRDALEGCGCALLALAVLPASAFVIVLLYVLVGSLPLWLDVAVIAAVGGFLLLAWLGGLLDTFRRGGQATSRPTTTVIRPSTDRGRRHRAGGQ